jgi:hypothetical protein
MGPTKAARSLVAKNPRAKSKRPGRAGHMAGDSVVGISCEEGLAVRFDGDRLCDLWWEMVASGVLVAGAKLKIERQGRQRGKIKGEVVSMKVIVNLESSGSIYAGQGMEHCRWTRHTLS